MEAYYLLFFIGIALLLLLIVKRYKKFKPNFELNKEPIDQFLENRKNQVVWVFRSKVKVKARAAGINMPISTIYSISFCLEDGRIRSQRFSSEKETINYFNSVVKLFPNASVGWSQEAFIEFKQTPTNLRNKKYTSTEFDVGYRGFIYLKNFGNFMVRIKIVFWVLLALSILVRMLYVTGAIKTLFEYRSNMSSGIMRDLLELFLELGNNLFILFFVLVVVLTAVFSTKRKK